MNTGPIQMAAPGRDRGFACCEVTFEVDVGEVEQHLSALGDLLCFVEVGFRGRPFAVYMAERRAGQETAGKVVVAATLTQPLDGPVQVELRRFSGAVFAGSLAAEHPTEVHPTKRKVAESDLEKSH